MLDWGVQKAFSDAFGFYSIWKRLWLEEPVGETKLIGPCDKQQKESGLYSQILLWFIRHELYHQHKE